MTLPETETEKDIKEMQLNASLETIIGCASLSDSGMVSRLANKVRRHHDLVAEGGEKVEAPEGVTLDSIMLTSIPVNENVENAAIQRLHDALHTQEIEESRSCDRVNNSVLQENLRNIQKGDGIEEDISPKLYLKNDAGVEGDESSNLYRKNGAAEKLILKEKDKPSYLKRKNDLTDKLAKNCKEPSYDWKIQIHSKPLNEYTENHALLSKCFPTLFPLGLSADDLGGRGPMSPIQRKTLMLFYDRRFATNQNFVFHQFNQQMRTQTNKAVSLRVDSGDPRTTELMEIVNKGEFSSMLKKAVENPNSEEASTIKRKILPVIKILGAKVKWSPFERKSTLSRHYALYHAFGLPFLFGTISPAMRNSPLAIRMCAKHLKKTWSIKEGLQLFPPVLLSNFHKRDREIMKNPVAAAQVFEITMRAFFTILMGIPLHHLRGKKSDFSRLLKKNEVEFVGAYGRIRAVYGVIEAQGSGGLHLHFHAWGVLDHSRMARFLHDPKFRLQVTNFIDKIVTCRIPERVVQQEKEAPRRVIAAEKYPNEASLVLDAATCRYYLQNHRHAATCWKRKNCATCRMAYKRMISHLTYITELIAVKDNSTGKWLPERRFPLDEDGQEKISPPLPIQRTTPVDPFDERITGFGMARTNQLEQYQVEANDITTSLLRCNTSMQPLIAPSQAKSSSYYAAKYVSKDPYELSTSLPFLYQAQQELRKFGSQADDSGQSDRNLKVLLQKVLHKVNKIEVSSQQAACAMLGYDSYYASHDFSYCFVWDAVKRLHEFENSDVPTSTESVSSDEDNSDTSNSLQSDDENMVQEVVKKNFAKNLKYNGKLTVNKKGKVITINQFVRYINKGPHFADYPLYDYSGIVRHHSNLKKNGDKSSTNSKRGRNSSKVYKYVGDQSTCCPDDSFGQTIGQKFCIPIIPGPAPPTYPGDKPEPPWANHNLQQKGLEEDNHEKKHFERKMRIWNKKAKIFVEFYSLLLLPWDERLDPRDPSNPELQILPWNSSTS